MTNGEAETRGERDGKRVNEYSSLPRWLCMITWMFLCQCLPLSFYIGINFEILKSLVLWLRVVSASGALVAKIQRFDYDDWRK